MKIIGLSFYCMVLFLFCSCTKKKEIETNLTEIHIDPSKIEAAYDITNDIKPEWDIIALETNDTSLISGIDRVLYQNGVFYILDKAGSSVFLFDSKGKFIKKLYKKGTGPDEYSGIEAFALVDSNIWISDPNGGFLICYNENLEVIDRIKVREYMGAFDMAAINDKIYLATNWLNWHESKNMQLGMYDTNSKEVTGLWFVPRSDDKIALMKKSSQLAKIDNSCLFIHSYCDTIFSVEDGKCIPKYKMVFNERYEDIPCSIDKILDPNNSEIIRGIEDIKQTKDKILIGYLDDNKFISAIYDMKDNTCTSYSCLINSNLADLKTYQYCTFFDKKNMISVFDPDAVLDFFGTDSILEKINNADKKKLETVISNLELHSNPVLIRYELK